MEYGYVDISINLCTENQLPTTSRKNKRNSSILPYLMDYNFEVLVLLSPRAVWWTLPNPSNTNLESIMWQQRPVVFGKQAMQASLILLFLIMKVLIPLDASALIQQIQMLFGWAAVKITISAVLLYGDGLYKSEDGGKAGKTSAWKILNI